MTLEQFEAVIRRVVREVVREELAAFRPAGDGDGAPDDDDDDELRALAEDRVAQLVARRPRRGGAR